MKDAKFPTFVPHAIVRTSMNGRPRQITIAGVCRADRLLRIDFPNVLEESQRIEFSIKECKKRLPEIEGFFYPVADIVINHEEKRSEVVNLKGELVEVLNSPATLPIIETKLL